MRDRGMARVRSRLWRLAAFALVALSLLLALAIHPPAVSAQTDDELPNATAEELCAAGAAAEELQLYGEAEALYRSALLVDPTDRCSLAALAAMQDRAATAEEPASEAEVKAQELCDAALDLEDELPREARALFEQALDSDPTNECAIEGLLGTQSALEGIRESVESGLRLSIGDVVVIGVSLLVGGVLAWLAIRWVWYLLGTLGRAIKILLSRWLPNRLGPRTGIVQVAASGDNASTVSTTIRGQLSDFGLVSPSSLGTTSDSMFQAIAKASPSGSDIIASIPVLWRSLKPGKLHRVSVAELSTSGSQVRLSIDMAGRWSRSHDVREVSGESVIEAATRAAEAIYDHSLHHGTQFGVRRRRRWTRKGSFAEFRRAHSQLNAANPSDAITALESLSIQEPWNIQIRLWWVRALLDDERYDEAVRVAIEVWLKEVSRLSRFKEGSKGLKRREFHGGRRALQVELAALLAYVSKWSGDWPSVHDAFEKAQEESFGLDNATLAVPRKSADQETVETFAFDLSKRLYSAASDTSGRYSDKDLLGRLQVLWHGISCFLDNLFDDFPSNPFNKPLRRAKRPEAFLHILAIQQLGTDTSKKSDWGPVRDEFKKCVEHDRDGPDARTDLYNTAIFYSRALEVRDQLDGDGSQEEALIAEGVRNMELAMSAPGWGLVHSNWMWRDPDLACLRNACLNETNQWPAGPWSGDNPYGPAMAPQAPNWLQSVMGSETETVWEEVCAEVQALTGRYPSTNHGVDAMAQLVVARRRAAEVNAELDTFPRWGDRSAQNHAVWAALEYARRADEIIEGLSD